MDEEERTRIECAGFCKNATNSQLVNIHHDELKRWKDHGKEGDTAKTAKIFAEEAKKELQLRGL